MNPFSGFGKFSSASARHEFELFAILAQRSQAAQDPSFAKHPSILESYGQSMMLAADLDVAGAMIREAAEYTF